VYAALHLPVTLLFQVGDLRVVVVLGEMLNTSLLPTFLCEASERYHLLVKCSECIVLFTFRLIRLLRAHLLQRAIGDGWLHAECGLNLLWPSNSYASASLWPLCIEIQSGF
jgi:hypothetical protein